MTLNSVTYRRRALSLRWLSGATENARLENAGPKLHGWKTQEKACMDRQMLLMHPLYVQIQPIVCTWWSHTLEL